MDKILVMKDEIKTNCDSVYAAFRDAHAIFNGQQGN